MPLTAFYCELMSGLLFILRGPFPYWWLKMALSLLGNMYSGSTSKVKWKLIRETKELGYLCFSLSWHDSHLK